MVNSWILSSTLPHGWVASIHPGEGIDPSQMQDIALPLGDLQEVLVRPFLQPGKIPLVAAHLWISPSANVLSSDPVHQ